MHEFQVGKHSVQLNNWQFSVLFFFGLSGIGMVAAAMMVIVDIIRWSLQ